MDEAIEYKAKSERLKAGSAMTVVQAGIGATILVGLNIPYPVDSILATLTVFMAVLGLVLSYKSAQYGKMAAENKAEVTSQENS